MTAELDPPVYPEQGRIPIYKGYGAEQRGQPDVPFPATICAVNDVICYGMPSSRQVLNRAISSA
jgi:hypothetical protein